MFGTLNKRLMNVKSNDSLKLNCTFNQLITEIIIIN